MDHPSVRRGQRWAPCGTAEVLGLAARLEGLILDPVYTAKALAGRIAAVRAGELDPTGPILFLHTGGAPGLFDARWSTFVG